MSKLSKRFTRARVVGIASILALGVGVVVLAGGYPGSEETRTLQAAAAVPPLGAAESFAVLAAAGVTNTGPTTVTGDLGTHPTAAVTGFFGTTANDGPGVVTGTIHQADATALSARTALTAAYNNAAAQPTDFAVGTELGGLTLVSGVYASGTLGITAGAGPLTLNGDADDVWVFKAASTLITSASSSVVLTGGAQACNVFWQIGSSATLGASSTLQGTILAHTSISVGNSATVVGRLLAGAVADSGAVTLDDDTVAVSVCALPPAATPTPTEVPATPTATPTPTATAIPSTPTATPGPGGGGTFDATPTATAIPATPTETPPAAAATPTMTAIPATPTETPPPAATPTSVPPTVAPTLTAIITPTTVAPTITPPVETPIVIPPVVETPVAADTPTGTSVPTPVGDTSTQTVTDTPRLPRAGGFPLPMEILALTGLVIIGLGWALGRRLQKRRI